jgi:hypothetical protein
MMRTPKMPPPPAPPPPPRPIPTATAPNVRQAAVEDARRNRGRAGRMSTMLSGSLGDGDYAAPDATATKKTMLG